MHKIKQSDIILVNLNDTATSVGTGQEVQAALMMGKPIIGFGNRNMNEWLSEVDCDVVFGSIHEAIDYISEFFIEK